MLTFNFYQLVIVQVVGCLKYLAWSGSKFGIKIYLVTTRYLLDELTVTFYNFLQLDFSVWRPCHTYLQNNKLINHKIKYFLIRNNLYLSTTCILNPPCPFIAQTRYNGLIEPTRLAFQLSCLVLFLVSHVAALAPSSYAVAKF